MHVSVFGVYVVDETYPVRLSRINLTTTFSPSNNQTCLINTSSIQGSKSPILNLLRLDLSGTNQ